jgi:GDPmannose 4,6-dehydratase
MAFAEIGVELSFLGEAEAEKGIVAACKNPSYQLPVGKVVVAVDPAYFRPTEVDLLIGDASKARNKLGWEPKYSLAELVTEMVQNDLKNFNKNN